MSRLETAPTEDVPIVIYRSVNRDGATFALDPSSLDKLLRTFGQASVHAHPRVFIAHASRADYEAINTNIVPQIVALLTGLSVDHLRPIGGVTFRDPVTDEDLLLRELS